MKTNVPILLIKHFFTSKRYPNAKLHYNAIISKNSKIAEFVYIGDQSIITQSYIGRFTQILSSTVSNCTIGAFSSIAANTKIGGGGKHPLNQVSTHPLFYSNSARFPNQVFVENSKFNDKIQPINIGNDVWIGNNVIVMQGITIGDGAVIGASALVTKDIPPYAVVGGVPAKIIKYRHDEKLREALIKSEWWNWSIPKLKIITKYFEEKDAMTLERFKCICDEAKDIK